MDAKFGSNQWVDSGQWILDDVSKSLMAHGVRLDPETESFIAFHPTQTPISSSNVCHAISANPTATAAVALYAPETANCLSASPSSNTSPNVASGQGDVVAFSAYNQTAEASNVSQTVAARSDQDTASCISQDLSVRRLTPRECERLQGFPDDFTKIPYRNKTSSECPDGPRYKALGNSMAVPVMKWIGERIEKVARLAGESNEKSGATQSSLMTPRLAMEDRPKLILIFSWSLSPQAISVNFCASDVSH